MLAFGANNANVLSSTITDLNWHHYTVTRSATTNALKIYIDGVLTTTATLSIHSRRRRSSRQVRHAQVRGSKQHLLRHARRRADLHARLVGRRGRDGYEYPGGPMGCRNGRHQLPGSLMISTSMNRAIGFSIVFLACLPLTVGCSSERSASGLLSPRPAALRRTHWFTTPKQRLLHSVELFRGSHCDIQTGRRSSGVES